MMKRLDLHLFVLLLTTTTQWKPLLLVNGFLSGNYNDNSGRPLVRVLVHYKSARTKLLSSKDNTTSNEEVDLESLKRELIEYLQKRKEAGADEISKK